jgi:hypothetical protein
MNEQSEHQMSETGPASSCANCEQPLPRDYRFCPNCGERNSDHRQSVRHLLKELLEHTVHFDSKIWRTLKSLFTRPGLLPVEFNRGKRSSVVAPLRFYIFVSFIFFVLMPMSGSKDATVPATSGKEAQLDAKFTFGPITSDELKGLNEAQIDALMVAKGMKPTALRRSLVHHAAEYANGDQNLWAEAFHFFLKGLSYMMFLLVPLFALMTFLFFRTPALYFVEHLVFALYFHGFYFSLLAGGKAFALLMHLPFFLGPAFPVSLAIILVYLWVALRRVFGQGKLITAVKAVVVFALYWLSVFFASGVVGVIAFLFL